VVTIETSIAARKTEAHREAMMMAVCSFVREASGSAGVLVASWETEASLLVAGVPSSFKLGELDDSSATFSSDVKADIPSSIPVRLLMALVTCSTVQHLASSLDVFCRMMQ